MTKGEKTGLSLSIVGVAFIGALMYFGKKVKDQGYSKNKALSKVFKVPYVDPKYSDLEEQQENIATAGGIIFN